MLLVQDDQPQLTLRREDRAPGADDDAPLTAVHTPPLLPVPCRREPAVQHAYLAREPRLEPGDGLWGQ